MKGSPPPLRAILEPTGTFRRNARRLPPRIRDELGLAVDELLGGNLSPGRNFEEWTNMPGGYSVRLSGGYRFVFGASNGVADPIAGGPHDQAYADAEARGNDVRTGAGRRVGRAVIGSFIARGRSPGPASPVPPRSAAVSGALRVDRVL